jgi:integrase
MRDRYYLMAYGPDLALRQLFPRHEGAFEQSGAAGMYRHSFPPAPKPITVERTLRQVCAKWQEVWDNRLTDLQEAQAAGVTAPADSLPRTIGEAVERYQSIRADELAPATRERNRHYLTRWLTVLGPNLLLSDLNEDRLVAGRGRLAKDLMPSTLNCTLAALKSVLRWAEGRGCTIHPAYRSVRGVREGARAREKTWWTTDEVELALTAAVKVDQELAKQTKKDGVPTGVAVLLVALGCLLGLRYEEIIMLRWEDLDLDRTSQKTGEPEPVAHITPKEGWTPKDGEARTIPMHRRLVEILRPYRQASGWVLNANKPMPKRGGTKRVYRYDPKTVWVKVLKAATAMGAKEITPHGMRHSFASNLLMAGVSDVLVARWLGHADTSMVHQHYGHLLAYHGDINRVQIGPRDGG